MQNLYVIKKPVKLSDSKPAKPYLSCTERSQPQHFTQHSAQRSEETIKWRKAEISNAHAATCGQTVWSCGGRILVFFKKNLNIISSFFFLNAKDR